MSEVKPGQVWKHRYSDAHWEVLHGVKLAGTRRWWPLKRVDLEGQKDLPEWMLLEDYVLVKEAP